MRAFVHISGGMWRRLLLVLRQLFESCCGTSKARATDCPAGKEAYPSCIHEPPDNFPKTGDIIGEGGFSVVHLCVLDGTCYAVKKFVAPESHEMALREARIHYKVHGHRHIVQLHCTTSNSSTVSLVMQYGGRRTLLDVATWNDCDRQEALLQLSSALSHMHRLQVAHMDVKAENVVVDDDTSRIHVRLCDFGLALDSEEVLTNRRGTPRYCAPEMFATGTTDPSACDVWSFAVLVIVVFQEVFPFRRASASKDASFASFSWYETECSLCPSDALNRSYARSPFNWRGLDRVLVDCALRVDHRRRADIHQVNRLLSHTETCAESGKV